MEKFDFHTHTTFSHGKNSPEEMLAAAQAAGITTLGISEHLPRLEGFRYLAEEGKEIRGLLTWQEYIERMQKLRAESRDKETKVLLGCEVDWMGKENLNYYKVATPKDVFDYTIGSVHFLTGKKTGKEIGFDSAADWEMIVSEFGLGIEEIYKAYFAEYTAMANSGLFDIAGHFDLIKIFRDKDALPAGVNILKLAQPALAAVKKAGMVMEISSAGFAKNLGEFYPSEDILRKACEMGIPVTFGSDAHSAERVGDKFDEAVDLARRIGYKEMIVFREGGKRESVRI
jgi:histidinol-phosphatase (PHP family)